MVGRAVKGAAILHGESIHRLQSAADHIADVACLENARVFVQHPQFQLLKALAAVAAIASRFFPLAAAQAARISATSSADL